MEMRQAYNLVKRRWQMIVSLAVLSMLVAAAVVLLQPPVYVATTTISTGTGQSSDWYATDLRISDMQTILVSHIILTKMNEQVKLNKPLEDIEKAIRITRLGNSSVLRVDVSWNDPVKAYQAANTLADLFVDYESGQMKAQAQQDVQMLSGQMKLAQDRLSRALQNQQTGDPNDPNVRAAEDELATARQNYLQTVSKYEAAQAAANSPADATNMQIIDRAIIPPKPEPNNLLRTVLFGGLLGAMIGIFVAVGSEYLNPVPNLLDTIQTKLGVPILAAIPWHRRFRRRRTETIDHLSPAQRMAYRQLCSNVLLSRRSLPSSIDERSGIHHLYAPLSLLVVSERLGSGCSSVVANLGAQLAKAGQRVLLVDTNLFDPALHLMVQRSPAPGLSEWLQNRDYPLDELIQTTDLPNLSLLASGNLNQAYNTLIFEHSIKDLIERLSENYDAIILDSPALDRSNDAYILREAVYDVIAVIRPSGNQDSRRAQQAVLFGGEKLMGIILNGAELDNSPVIGLSVVQQNRTGVQESEMAVTRRRAARK